MADDSLLSEIPNLKHCRRCGLTKPFSDFNKSKTGKHGLQSKCRECGRKASRSWYELNKDTERLKSRLRMRVYGPKRREENRRWAAKYPEKARYHSRKKLLGKKYNMTIEEHDALFASQGFACGACGSPTPNSKKGWSTDHCHKTGAVRGIVCHHCNIGIGHAKDSIKTLRAWISYLERSSRSKDHAPSSAADQTIASEAKVLAEHRDRG